MAISNPLLWSFDRVRAAGATLGHPEAGEYDQAPAHYSVARIGIEDLRTSLRAGIADFAANRTDVLFLCFLYPVLGLIAARFAVQGGLLPLLFPLASGFALVGPLAGVGLYEISRRRERGEPTSWFDPLRVFRAPAIGAIAVLGAILMGLLLLWLIAAAFLYQATLGPEPPASIGAFLTDVFATPQGWAMIIAGGAIGFCFAAIAFSIAVVSFPLLLDRDAGLDTAVRVSALAVWRNPLPMAAWALLIAVSLVVGSIPLLLGLPIVLPILGHATWHLYRRVVSSRPLAA